MQVGAPCAGRAGEIEAESVASSKGLAWSVEGHAMAWLLQGTHLSRGQGVYNESCTPSLAVGALDGPLGENLVTASEACWQVEEIEVPVSWAIGVGL